jgi:hypothetical protein
MSATQLFGSDAEREEFSELARDRAAGEAETVEDPMASPAWTVTTVTTMTTVTIPTVIFMC